MCNVFDTNNKKWVQVAPSDMIKGIRGAVKALDLDTCGINPDLVGVHSLIAGGDMALKLRHRNHETRKMDISHIPPIHSQPNCTPQQRHLQKDGNKTGIPKHISNRIITRVINIKP